MAKLSLSQVSSSLLFPFPFLCFVSLIPFGFGSFIPIPQGTPLGLFNSPLSPSPFSSLFCLSSRPPCYLPSYLLTQASLQILSKLSFLSPSCLFVADGSPILILLGSLLVPPHVATTFWFLLGWFPFVCPSHPIWLNVVQLRVYQYSSACWSRCDAWVTSLVAARQRNDWKEAINATKSNAVIRVHGGQ